MTMILTKDIEEGDDFFLISRSKTRGRPLYSLGQLENDLVYSSGD